MKYSPIEVGSGIGRDWVVTDDVSACCEIELSGAIESASSSEMDDMMKESPSRRANFLLSWWKAGYHDDPSDDFGVLKPTVTSSPLTAFIFHQAIIRRSSELNFSQYTLIQLIYNIYLLPYIPRASRASQTSSSLPQRASSIRSPLGSLRRTSEEMLVRSWGNEQWSPDVRLVRLVANLESHVPVPSAFKDPLRTGL